MCSTRGKSLLDATISLQLSCMQVKLNLCHKASKRLTKALPLALSALLFARLYEADCYLLLTK